MEINCVEISIHDDDLGCQIIFSDKITGREAAKSPKRYLLIQKAFPEDGFDNDNIYFETHYENYTGELAEYEMELSKRNFILNLSEEDRIEVSINPTDKQYLQLKKILPVLTNKTGRLIITD